MKKFRRLRSLINFELDVTFRFPLIELLFIFIISLTVIGIYGQIHPPSFYIVSEYDVSEYTIERLIQRVTDADILLISLPINILTLILYGLIPLIVSFLIAYDFESNLFKRYISYPIRRHEILVLRFILIWTLICLPTTVGIVVPLLSIGVVNNPSTILAILASFYIATFLVTSISVLLAILTRKTSYSALGGLGLFSLLLTASYIPNESYFINGFIRGLCNPVYVTTQFFSGNLGFGGIFGELTTNDVLYSNIGSILLGVCMLILALLVIRRMDV